MSELPEAELWLVRHGETVGESSTRLHGRNDVELDALGRRQMAQLAALLRSEPFDRAYTSPLVRAHEAARIILADRPPAPSIVADFAEMHFGDWEGLTLDEARARDPDLYGAFHRKDPEF